MTNPSPLSQESSPSVKQAQAENAPTVARWFDNGLPSNIVAAAQDALEWLELLLRLNTVKHSILDRENASRLGSCIGSLRAHIDLAEAQGVCIVKAEGSSHA